MKRACNVLHFYCHLWSVRLYNIFSHLLTNGTIFGNKVIKQSVTIFCINLSEIFLILRRIQRDIIANVRKSSCKVLVILARFWRTLDFLHNFSRIPNIGFHENPSSDSRAIPCGRTDMTKVIVTSRNFANASQNDCTVTATWQQWHSAKH